ncbi:MAG: phosphatidylserine decarboxylase family protein [Vicinamibacteria bacterium]
MTIAREGWVFVGTLLGIGLLLALFRLPWFAGVVLALGLFTAFFFRDPERVVPTDPRLVLSPADGKVILVVPAPADHAFGPGTTQVSIFLSVFDVHINRSPIAGTVTRAKYHPGKFLPAWDDKASLQNEQNAVTVENGADRIEFKQIAGLIARRIVFKKREGDAVGAGERVGLIKFGSRVDVFLPAGVKIRVAKGDRVTGGETVLAERS